MSTSLPDSRLYTAIDSSREFALYFLEGQKLINDLALTHNIRGEGFSWFRDVVLSVQPMIALLKHGEQLGFYIDSDDPMFRLKIEASHFGGTRCALTPESFDQFPESMHGLVRVQKLFPGNKAPYMSILKIDGKALGDLVNQVLDESYQVDSIVLLSDKSDQSVMIHRLPAGKDDDRRDLAKTHTVKTRLGATLQAVLARSLNDANAIQEALQQAGFRILASRPIRFVCSCSRERVLKSLQSLNEADRKDLFHPGEETLQVTCEYCKAEHEISRSDMESGGSPPS
jgi:molecular chaperone Hsp33